MKLTQKPFNQEPTDKNGLVSPDNLLDWERVDYYVCIFICQRVFFFF